MPERTSSSRQETALMVAAPPSKNGVDSFAKYMSMMFAIAVASAAVVLWISSSFSSQAAEFSVGQSAQDREIRKNEVTIIEMKAGLTNLNDKVLDVREVQSRQDVQLNEIKSLLLELRRDGKNGRTP